MTDSAVADYKRTNLEILENLGKIIGTKQSDGNGRKSVLVYTETHKLKIKSTWNFRKTRSCQNAVTFI